METFYDGNINTKLSLCSDVLCDEWFLKSLERSPVTNTEFPVRTHNGNTTNQAVRAIKSKGSGLEFQVYLMDGKQPT